MFFICIIFQFSSLHFFLHFLCFLFDMFCHFWPPFRFSFLVCACCLVGTQVNFHKKKRIQFRTSVSLFFSFSFFVFFTFMFCLFFREKGWKTCYCSCLSFFIVICCIFSQSLVFTKLFTHKKESNFKHVRWAFVLPFSLSFIIFRNTFTIFCVFHVFCFLGQFCSFSFCIFHFSICFLFPIFSFICS